MRYTLKRTAFILCLWLLLLPTLALAQASAQKVVLYRWVDDAGVVHYTEGLESIPAAYRSIAVKGSFVPDAGSIVPAKASGRLEEVEETYTREGNFYHIKGKVRNGFSQEISQVKVKISFFDEEDRFLFAETTLVDPIVLAAGQIGQYHLMVNYNPKVDTYKTELIGRP
ncbi:MAG: DUF4124 domain-containing protein [Candidatus Lernaella stagnicola]|nr:DUF4124 domain-containing protein [Candidatus Lernaella stagnicola]